MMNIIKAILLFCLSVLPSASDLKAQIDSVKLLLEYNTKDDVFDVSYYIAGGTATSVLHRTATSSQISILVPTGASFDIFKKYMPLQNNQNFAGTKPLEWSKGNSVKSPYVIPDYDIYSIVPILSPASHFNNLNTGDTVKLFSLKIKLASGCLEDIRLYDEKIAPPDSPAFLGADFSQGITIGGTKRLYTGNLRTNYSHVNHHYFSLTNNEEIMLESTVQSFGNWKFWSDSTGLELSNISPGLASLITTENAIGEYTLICRNDSITDVVCININENTSVNEFNQSNQLIVSPNPVTDFINIPYNDYDVLKVYSIDGHLVWKSHQMVSNIDVSSWMPNAYMIHLLKGNQSRFAKFIKI